MFKQFFSAITNFFKPSVAETQIMCIRIDLVNNTIECLNWYGQQMPHFSGTFTLSNFARLAPHCRLHWWKEKPGFAWTTISIWAGMDRKHLAQSEHPQPYFDNPYLVPTGTGFHHGSGRNYIAMIYDRTPVLLTHKRVDETIEYPGLLYMNINGIRGYVVVTGLIVKFVYAHQDGGIREQELDYYQVHRETKK